MRYACLIYYDPRQLFGGSPEAKAALDECASFDDTLKASGQLVLGEALELPDGAMTVQVRDGKMSAVDRPFMATKEMLGGFVLIEARDLNEAVRVASTTPWRASARSRSAPWWTSARRGRSCDRG